MCDLVTVEGNIGMIKKKLIKFTERVLGHMDKAFLSVLFFLIIKLLLDLREKTDLKRSLEEDVSEVHRHLTASYRGPGAA